MWLEENISSGDSVFAMAREVIEEMACVTKSMRPKMDIDGFWIVVHGMKQLGPCHLCKFPNSMFSNARLMMGTNTTQGYGLLGLLDIC